MPRINLVPALRIANMNMGTIRTRRGTANRYFYDLSIGYRQFCMVRFAAPRTVWRDHQTG